MAQHSPSLTTITQIDPRHYKNLLENNDDAFTEEETVFSELTRVSDNSNILHIAASTNQADMIDYIVLKCPILVTQPDSRGDIPIQVAVRAGHENAVYNLVSLANDNYLENYNANLMLMHENEEKNTALHIALENQEKKMAEYLFEKCPNVFYCMNMHGITPLYLAIKAGFWELVGNMLELFDDSQFGSKICQDQFLKCPVIHATIMAKNKDILEKIIRKNPYELIHSMDEKGRRPLSYAAYIGFLDGVNCIITMTDDQANVLYKTLAFKTDRDGSFPIHSACAGGHIEVVRELLSLLPKTMRWLLNKKGQTILHVAAQNGKAKVVEYLLREENGVERMINMKDEDGYTPLHLGTLAKNARVVYDLTWDVRTKLHLQGKDGFTPFDLAQHYGDVPSFEERLTWLALTYAGAPKSPQIHQNIVQIISVENQQIPPETMLIQPRKHINNKYKDRINTLLIISTLVATATFASGFTVPGGFNNSNPNQGIATLDHRLAFKVFVISNTMAMYSSVLAMVTLIWAHLDDLRLSLVSLDIALPVLGIALGAMSVAFMMGVYVVLSDLVWLGVVVLVMGGVFLSVLFVVFMPFYCPTSFIKYRVTRCVFHVPFMLMLWVLETGKGDALLLEFVY